MATPVQRLQAIADAMLNRVATPAELGRIGDAIAFVRLDNEYATKTNAEKAALTVDYLFRTLLGTIKNAEATKAEMAAREARPADTEFTPAP